MLCFKTTVAFILSIFRSQHPTAPQHMNQNPPTSIAALGDAAAALQLGYPNPHPPNPYLNTGSNMQASHQDYLNRLHASALASAADQHALEGTN